MHLILSPHLDDAVLSLGGLLAKEGHDATVATFFAGMPQPSLTTHWDTKCGFRDSAEAMHARLAENRDALLSLGVTPERIQNYNYLETEYRRDATPASEQELQHSIKETIKELLKSSPQPLVLYAPGLEFHPDHNIVKRAALAAFRDTPARGARLFLYQDIPYVYKRSFLGHVWDRAVGKAPRWNTPIPLTEEDMQKKLRATQHYASQVPHLGSDLLEDIRQYAAQQAKKSSVSAPYCEITHKAV